MVSDADKKYVDGYNAGFKHGRQKMEKELEAVKENARKTESQWNRRGYTPKRKGGE